MSEYAMTEQQIADELGISQQRVHAIIQNALRKLRKHGMRQARETVKALQHMRDTENIPSSPVVK